MLLESTKKYWYAVILGHIISAGFTSHFLTLADMLVKRYWIAHYLILQSLLLCETCRIKSKNFVYDLTMSSTGSCFPLT